MELSPLEKYDIQKVIVLIRIFWEFWSRPLTPFIKSVMSPDGGSRLETGPVYIGKDGGASDTILGTPPLYCPCYWTTDINSPQSTRPTTSTTFNIITRGKDSPTVKGSVNNIIYFGPEKSGFNLIYGA